MLNLLTIESLKLRRNRSFWVLTILFAFSMFGINYLVSEISGNALESFMFPKVWQEVAYVSSFMLIIPSMIIIMHTCAEYTYRTHRQNIIDGLSRNQYITTKIMFVVLLALLSTLLTFLSAFVIGLSADAPVSFANFKYIFYYLVQALAYISLAFLMALVFKRAAVTIGIFFLYSMVFENVLERYLNKINIGDLLPLASSDHLINFPILSEFISAPKHSEYLYLSLSLCYIVLMYVFCYYKYQRQDL